VHKHQLTADSGLACLPFNLKLLLVATMECSLCRLDRLIRSIHLVVSLTRTEVDIVHLGLAVEDQLGHIGDTSLLVSENGVVDIIIVVDIGSFGNGANSIDLGLASCQNLNGALPDAIDLGQCSRGNISSSMGNGSNTGSSANNNPTEPGRSLRDDRLALNDGLLSDDLVINNVFLLAENDNLVNNRLLDILLDLDGAISSA